MVDWLERNDELGRASLLAGVARGELKPLVDLEEEGVDLVAKALEAIGYFDWDAWYAQTEGVIRIEILFPKGTPPLDKATLVDSVRIMSDVALNPDDIDIVVMEGAPPSE